MGLEEGLQVVRLWAISVLEAFFVPCYQASGGARVHTPFL